MGIFTDSSETEEGGSMELLSLNEEPQRLTTRFKINEDVIYDFDEASGVLSVSASPEGCELLMRAFEIREGGEPRDIILPGGFAPSTPKKWTFAGVKKIVSGRPRAEDGQWYLDVVK